jgi:uncharacterized protein
MMASEPRYHVRFKNREVTDPEQIREILKKATVCRIGLMDVDNNIAYIVPVNYGYDGKCIYFHSALKGHKVDLMGKNNKVCIEIEGDYAITKTEKSPCAVKYQSIVGRGTANIVEDDDAKVHGLETLIRQCSADEYKYSSERLKTVLVIRIDIESMTCKQTGF